MTDLEDVHELSWSVVDGAYVRVEQEVDNRDPLDPVQDDRTDIVRTEFREGTVVGRHRGWKVKWLPDDGDFADPVSPIIVLETPADTYLEVATDTHANELLVFEPEGDPDA